MIENRLILKYIIFTGPLAKPARVDFKLGSNLIYGASNTGKSFTLKAIDYMLGASANLPDFVELEGYETIWLGFSLTEAGDFTLSRATKGGNYKLYNGFVTPPITEEHSRILRPDHDSSTSDNLSSFLLNHLNFKNKFIAKNAAGHKDSLSFRNLAHILLSDETSIQSERSPIESGQHLSRSKERNVFRFLVTGTDDSAIAPTLDKKEFNTSRVARLEVLDDMISEIESKLLTSNPNVDDLYDQNERLEDTFKKIQIEFDALQGSIKTLITMKHNLSVQIPNVSERLEELQLHITRFQKLDDIYLSDIERLSGLEEIGFLLSLGNDRTCQVCGAPPESQKHTHGLESVEQIRRGSLLEIAKIEQQRLGLALTVQDLKKEHKILLEKFLELNEQLSKVEREITLLSPELIENKNSLSQIMSARDNVRRALDLVEQMGELKAKRELIHALKQSPKINKLDLLIPDAILHNFCKVVSDVLVKWQFPGECQVSFDKGKYDLKIDGKSRTSNGKGVRALTHAAFKVALLLFCNKYKLPHPGLIILDTPLLTYRDPQQNHKSGELSEDEELLAQTCVKQCFFEHLASIRELGQFIILENVDPPSNIEQFADVQLFDGIPNKDGRNGFFPFQ